MGKRTIENVQLGGFVLTGLVLLILFLYFLGRNKSIFSTRFEVEAHFENVNGLVPGNNVRLSGIVIGIVEDVRLLNDTLVVVSLALDEKTRAMIRKNAEAAVGTDGLIGNRVVNIIPVKDPAAFIEPGDVLQGRKEVDTDDMLRTLDLTNRNVLRISESLRLTMDRVNRSTQLAALLDDDRLSENLIAALVQLRSASRRASESMDDLHAVVEGVRAGEGSVGMLLRDTALAVEFGQTIRKLQNLEAQADELVKAVQVVVQDVQTDLQQGPGPVRLVLKDSLAAARLQNTVNNLEQGTARFNENMEALKHNFLFRGYFKKQAKKAGQ